MVDEEQDSEKEDEEVIEPEENDNWGEISVSDVGWNIKEVRERSLAEERAEVEGLEKHIAWGHNPWKETDEKYPNQQYEFDMDNGWPAVGKKAEKRRRKEEKKKLKSNQEE